MLSPPAGESSGCRIRSRPRRHEDRGSGPAFRPADQDDPLQDVRQILESRRSGVCTCASLQDTIRTKAGEIEQKIAALRDLHSEREDLLSRWQDCGGRKTTAG